MTAPRLLAALVACTLSSPVSFSSDLPLAVSPGSPSAVVQVGERCPTFSWGAVPRAVSYRLAVYLVDERAAEQVRVVLSEALPGSASSWTPPLHRCLATGATYAWRVGADTGGDEPVWSVPAWFEVPVDGAWQPGPAATPGGDSPQADADLGTNSGRVTAAATAVGGKAPGVAAARMLATYFSVGTGGAVTAGAVTADSLAGDGAGVTNVNAATLQGNAASAFAAAAHAHDERYFTETELSTNGGGGAVHWGNITSMPAGFADGHDADTNTTYTAGTGLALVGTQFSLVAAGNARPVHSVTSLDTVDDVGSGTSVAVGADGLPIIAYYDATNDDLKVARCEDLACTSATITTLDAGGDVGRYPSIAVGADGLPLISYYDATNVDLKVAHCKDTACASATITTLDGTDDVGTHTSVAIGANGLGLVSYYDLTNSDLKLARCTDFDCSAATLLTVDSGGDVGSYTSVTVGVDGLALMSYEYRTADNLKVAHCDSVNCASPTLTTLDSGGLVGSYSSLTIGSDGLGIISYFDNTSFNLKVAHCEDLACTTATITNLDLSDTVGIHTSVTVGADGLPLISYSDDSYGDLKVAHCGNVACTSATITRVDATAADVGDYTSVTIGADGQPLITYYDLTHGDLKVVHCANAFCTPFVRRR